MTPLAQAISEALVQFIWQGFLVSLLVSVAALPFRKHSPNVRYLLFCAALLLLAVLPVITAIEFYDPLSANNPGPAAITLTIRAVWNDSVPAMALHLNKWLTALQPWVLRVWLAGVAFLSLRLAWLAARVAWLRNSGGPVSAPVRTAANELARRMGMTRALRILVSSIPDGPGVIGWFRPAILLPAAAVLNLSPDQLEAILAHEIAHLRRYDDVVNIVQSVVETLLFYHPAVWWISNRIRHERELCCDDLAVSASGNALCYARALTALEVLRVMPVNLALGAASSPLEYRIRRILGERTQIYMPSGLSGMLALGLALACVTIYSAPGISAPLSGSARGSVPGNSAHPAYPEAARVHGIEGTVPVEVKIDDQGNVSHARAIGGPRELRQAAVDSASALRFAREDMATARQVNVAFQLDPLPLITAPVPSAVVIPPGRTGPGWRDEGESSIGIAATNAKDPDERLELLRQWEQLYPVSEFRSQRALMIARALLAVLSEAYGNTDPDVLDAAKRAAQQLAEHFDEYLDDSLKPAALTREEWAETRRTSELQIHTVLAYIAQANRDDDTAEVELRKVLAVDPEQASASAQLGLTIVHEVANNGNGARYPEAIFHLAHSLAVTGASALTADARRSTENALRKNYADYHGNTEGLDDVIRQASASAMPPSAFSIASVANPNPDLWETTRAALSEQGDSYLARLKDAASPWILEANVVSQLSLNRLLVNVHNVNVHNVNVHNNAAGDAILSFDGSNVRAYRPGALLQFRGVVDGYSQNPYILTFVIRNPERDIVWLNHKAAPHHGIFARVFGGLFRLVRRLA